MPKLCAFGCAPGGTPMHRFPNAEKFPERFKTWVTLIGGKLETADDYEYYQKKTICDKHFTIGDRVRNNRLSALAIPSLHLHGAPCVAPHRCQCGEDVVSCHRQGASCFGTQGLGTRRWEETRRNDTDALEEQPASEFDTGLLSQPSTSQASNTGIEILAWDFDTCLLSQPSTSEVTDTAVLLLVGVELPASCVAHSTMTKNLKVLVSSNDFPASGLKVLEEHFTVLQTKYLNFGEEGRTLAKEDLLKLIPGCSALVWSSNLPISKELLDKAGPQLKLVATVSAGYNHCNLDELRARGIKLSNTPNVLAPAVAEIAIALMLGAARRFTENLEQVHKGEWEIGFDKVLGQDVRGSTVGIIGLGGIGQAVAKRLAGFEVEKIVYSGHREKPEGKALGAEFVSQDQLLAQSDFIVLAVPLTNETKHLVNKDTLRKMKENAILINVGRGDLVDQEALYDALKSKQIYAAGLDVTTPEPLPKDHKLLTLPNLFVLPHIGSATVRTRSDMGVLAANNVVNALTGKALLTPVNL